MLHRRPECICWICDISIGHGSLAFYKSRAMALWELQMLSFFSLNTCNHILYIHAYPTNRLKYLNPPYYFVCFLLRRKWSQCQLTQGLSSLHAAEVIPFKALTLCQGHRCPLTSHLKFHKAFIPLFSYSSQFLTQHTYFNVTQTMVAFFFYYWKHHVAITKLSALQRQGLQIGEGIT